MKEKALPEGWVETTLADVVKIVRGVSYKKEQSSNEPLENYLPILRANNIKDEHLNFDELVYVQSELIKAEQKIKKNDVLVAMSSGSKLVVGKTARVEQNIEMGFGAFCAILRPNTDIEPKLVSQFTQSAYYRSEISRLSAGGTINNLKPAYFKEIIFPLPPLETQQKLAKKFTALLSQVAEIKQRLEKIPALLKTYRQSVLARAVNGELSAKWREENGVSLESWAISTLKNLTTKIGSGSTPKGAEYLPEGVPFIRSLNIYTHFIKFDDLAFINDEQAQKLKNVVIEQGDLLLNITGASIGRVNIAPKEFIGGRVNQHVAIIRSKLDKIRPHFLHIFFASPKIQKWINDENYGSTRQALTKGMLEELKIAVPSLEEQNYITQAVEKHLNFANQLEVQVNAALERVNLMTQAILAKGFRGELI